MEVERKNRLRVKRGGHGTANGVADDDPIPLERIQDLQCFSKRGIIPPHRVAAPQTASEYTGESRASLGSRCCLVLPQQLYHFGRGVRILPHVMSSRQFLQRLAARVAQGDVCILADDAVTHKQPNVQRERRRHPKIQLHLAQPDWRMPR